MPGENNQYVNPNLADTETLRRLPGIGAEIAKRLIAARPFDDVDDLRRVPGLGQSTLERIAPYLTFDTDQEGLDGSSSDAKIGVGINGGQDVQAVAQPEGDDALQEQAFEALADTSSQVEPGEPEVKIAKRGLESAGPQTGICLKL